MAKTEVIRVRVTPEEKEHLKAVCERRGMTTSAVMAMHIRQFLQADGIPFVVEEKTAGRKLRNAK